MWIAFEGPLNTQIEVNYGHITPPAAKWEETALSREDTGWTFGLLEVLMLFLIQIKTLQVKSL